MKSLTAALVLLLLVQAVFTNAPNHLSTSESHDYGYSSSNTGGWWVGFILGPIVFVASFVCIWYNEKRAAIDSRRLQLGREICEDVDVTSQQSARRQENKLVYANGMSNTNTVIGDPLSGINGPNLIKITRVVQVLEWRRKTRKEGEHHVQYYELEWASTNSQNQGQRFNNPSNWFINNDVIYNQKVFLGGYNLSKQVADKCCRTVPFNPTMDNAQTILRNTNRGDRVPSLSGQFIYFTPSQGGYNPQFGGYGGNGGEGTLRVHYVLCPTGPISLVAKSAGPTFSSFDIAQYEGTKSETNKIPDCCCCLMSACYAELLKPIELILEVAQENVSKDEMFDRAVQKSQCFTRVMRILSFVCMVLGIYLFFSPIVNLIGFIPLVGGIISGILGFAIFLAAVLISIPLYILATAIAWLIFHPKVGLILLGIGAIIFVIIVLVGRNKDGGSSSSPPSHFLAYRQAFS